MKSTSIFIIVFVQLCESYDQLCEFQPSIDVEKNPGPTQYNTDHHEVII